MAGANTKDIKRRIKSVESTMQITKAMELVASSKLRKAKERVETARPFFTMLYDTMRDAAISNRDFSSAYVAKWEVKKSAFVVIAGDRGLAGGYNANVLKYATQLMEGKNALVIPIGKKVGEYFSRRGYELHTEKYHEAEGLYLEDAYDIAQMLTAMYRAGKIDEIRIVYTKFVSMLTQTPDDLKALPLNFSEELTEKPAAKETLYDPSMVEVLDVVVPQYVGGLIYGAVTESFASEQGARRTAMEAASDNADTMISDLNLKFNRARQAAITQELTEIVSGANALQ